MSKDWIIDDAYFGKIKKLPWRGDVIKQFINDVVYEHPNWGVLLKNLSDLYVLVASFDAQSLLKDGEKTWKEIMNKENYDILEKNKQLVIAYMLVKEDDENIHYIELFDTVVRKNNLGYYMINKYKKNKDYAVSLIPQTIIGTSAKYWAKILGVIDVIDDKVVFKRNLIDDFIEIRDINPEEISWNYLYDLCDEDAEPVSTENLQPE